MALRHKQRVLIFVDWFLPGYKAGGPIKSVSNIVNSLKDEIDFHIVTSNTDYGEPCPYTTVEADKWLIREGYSILYLSKAQQSFRRINELLSKQKYDVIYFNSLFSFKFTLLPLFILKLKSFRTRVILAPRGMLGKGALDLKKNKKKSFLFLARLLRLYKNITWHASSSYEAAEIKNYFGDLAHVVVAQNIASAALEQTPQLIKTKSNTAFFFLSRINPKKNLLGAIKLLASLPINLTYTFNIIGPVEDEDYWRLCKEEYTSALPAHIRVNYLGAIPNPEMSDYLKNFHFLLLPTFSENYGHVVVEALANACPVILSDQTPWRQLEAAQVGWDIPLQQEEKFREVLARCVAMEDGEYQHMRRQTQRYLQEKIVTADIIAQNRRLFDV